MNLPDRFRAYVVDHDGDDVERGLRDLRPADLPEGEVTVRVRHSTVNYKDALAVAPRSKVARISPLIPGVDLAGEVVASDDEQVPVGSEVIAHAHEIGVSRHGGFAEYARVPSAWVVPLPDGLSTFEAMALGTAGYTAALSVHLLEQHGLRPDHGPVLVTGATGGVGSTAVSMLAGLGFTVCASTGSESAHDWLRDLGAAETISREETSAAQARPLERGRWAGAVDCVGGATLAYVLRTLQRGAAVAASGNTGGVELHTTVFPFILRGVALLGVDSVETPPRLRREIWTRLGSDLKPAQLRASIAQEVTLDDLDEVLERISRGGMQGRAVVRIAG